MSRRIASLAFPRLGSDRFLRARPQDGPFALTIHQDNADRLHCLNATAEAEGLRRGMGFSDARALCPDLRTAWADLAGDARFLLRLARWTGRYCPWVGLEGEDGLALDVTGSAHLFGGEAAMIADIRARMARVGLDVRIGLADTRGAAWALARFDPGIAAKGEGGARLAPLPVAALRLTPDVCAGLERMGIATIAQLAAPPRRTVARRFGDAPLMRLDQALGRQAEPVSPAPAPLHFAARLTLPEPIGLTDDVAAGLRRLLRRLCVRLQEAHKGARVLRLTLRRVDRASAEVELRLAAPMRDPERIARLFDHHLGDVDAGFGIDQLRLEAVRVEDLTPAQIGRREGSSDQKLADLITRLGNRVGLEKITRFLPADSHIPERSFLIAPAAYSRPDSAWPSRLTGPPRPLRLFPPEPIDGAGPRPPPRFRWRAMTLTTARATGPERIAPEWWFDDPAWRSGLRDYWRVETRQGRRLWLFFTPQNPGWFAQGEFA